MDAFGIEVKGRNSPELYKPKIIKSNNTAVRSDSILDLKEASGRRSSEPVITSSEEEERRRRRRGRSRRKSSPGEEGRRRIRRSSEPAVEDKQPSKPTLHSRNDVIICLNAWSRF